MSLIHKLESIYIPAIPQLQHGSADTIDEFWDSFIEKRLPSKDVVLAWHEVLKEYIQRQDAVFVIRGYNTAPKDSYDNLRRGFLSDTNDGYSFFYSDNFHAAYYFKMVMDGFIPTVDELIDTYKSRRFPSRFGIDTAQERAMMAIPKGQDPRIQRAGYKIAHIINVGTDYYIDGQTYSLSGIIDKFFNRGERCDWNLITDSTGTYYLRKYNVRPEARKYLVAEFLRFVHPFNYFLTPKKTCAASSVSSDIAEYRPLVDYVRNKYAGHYGEAYEEFLNMIFVDTSLFTNSLGTKTISLKYGFGIAQSNGSSVRKVSRKSGASNQTKKNVSQEPVPTSNLANKPGNIPNTRELIIVEEYLRNPSTSFRKLERQYLGINSQAHGGGFVAKTIINKYGVTANDRGVLNHTGIEYLIENSADKLKQTLIKIKENAN